MVKDEALHAERAQALLLAIDSREDGVSRSEAAEAMRCAGTQAGYHLKLLVDKGMIVRVRGGVRSRYCRPAHVAYVLDYLEEQEYAALVAIKRPRVNACEVRAVLPARPITSVFAFAEAMA